MIASRDRRTGPQGLSPREAAFATGVSEKTINQAIDRDEVYTLPRRRLGDRDRMLGFAELVYLRLREGAGRLLSPEGRRQLRQQLTQACAEGEPPAVISIGAVEVHVAPEVRALREKLAEIQAARALVAADLEQAGEPVLRGPRISVHSLGDKLRQGVTRQELLEDHPALTPELLDAALLYARLYPRRGRPRRAARDAVSR